MTFLKDAKLELRAPVKPADAEDDDLHYDPHLQEETLRLWAKQDSSPEVSTKPGMVDVIAKLDAKAKVPDEIKDSCVIGVLDKFQIVTGAVAPANIKKVRAQVESLKAAVPVHLHLFNSVPAIRCDPKSLDAAARENGKRYSGLDGSDVIIGIVDFGCDFRHQNFRHSNGTTRILYLWDQAQEQSDAPCPRPFNYGRELTADLIDRALAAGDESAYRVLSYTPPIVAHGTHVMDIAAGNGREPALFNGKPSVPPGQASSPGVAPHAQIIFVNLKSLEGGFLGNSRSLLDAVTYIFRKADELGKPAVVNLSLSTTGGPHDGTTPVEQGFEALVTARPGRAIVTSAGNAFTMRSHVSGEVSRSSGRKILWQTDPRNTDPEKGPKNEIEIWYPKGRTLKVTLYAPGEDKIPLGSVALDETRELFAGERRLGRISHRKKDPNNLDNHVDIRLPHLEDFPGKPWTIELSSGARKDGVPFHSWIEQSERGLSRFEGNVESTVTLGSISCGNGTLTVGAFDTSEKAALALPYDATSAGPIRETDANLNKTLRSKPELSAPGVNIVAARAQGGVTSLSGTSMAAPHVTGLIALLFQLAHVSDRGLLSFSKVCNILTQGVQPLPAVRLPNPYQKDPGTPKHDLRLGDGRIDGPLSIAALMELVLRSFSLELKLTEKDIRAFVDNKPDFKALFGFLNTHTRLSGNNNMKVSEFVAFFEEQVGKSEFFRISMESLAERNP